MIKNPRKNTRIVSVGNVLIGGRNPIVIQSMCATKTVDALRTAAMAQKLHEAGAGVVRIAVDTLKDAEALPIIRQSTDANLSVDLQENYKLASKVAPFVDKIRYNPGHLHHREPEISWENKVHRLAEIADVYECALRIGVNCGSIDPNKSADEDPMLQSAIEHADFLDNIGFHRFCVSLKSSDPACAIEINRKFSSLRPSIPLHLGVTEAGMPPEGITKSRAALEPLIAEGIGDTIRVSLTVPNDRKTEEIDIGQMILKNVALGIVFDGKDYHKNGLNIISCPSCSRVENESFVQLAQKVREATAFASSYPIKIAVMGCRVNGPGETNDADIGLWCGPESVHLKAGEREVGVFKYEEIIPEMLKLLDIVCKRFENN